jgi:hypothetical protein
MCAAPAIALQLPGRRAAPAARQTPLVVQPAARRRALLQPSAGVGVALSVEDDNGISEDPLTGSVVLTSELGIADCLAYVPGPAGGCDALNTTVYTAAPRLKLQLRIFGMGGTPGEFPEDLITVTNGAVADGSAAVVDGAITVYDFYVNLGADGPMTNVSVAEGALEVPEADSYSAASNLLLIEHDATPPQVRRRRRRAVGAASTAPCAPCAPLKSLPRLPAPTPRMISESPPPPHRRRPATAARHPHALRL